MATFESDLGKVTAYAYAVDAGYQGTEAEFEEDLLNAVSTFETDKNLLLSDKAADAKVTGQKITKVKSMLDDLAEQSADNLYYENENVSATFASSTSTTAEIDFGRKEIDPASLYTLFFTGITVSDNNGSVIQDVSDYGVRIYQYENSEDAYIKVSSFYSARSDEYIEFTTEANAHYIKLVLLSRNNGIKHYVISASRIAIYEGEYIEATTSIKNNVIIPQLDPIKERLDEISYQKYPDYYDVYLEGRIEDIKEVAKTIGANGDAFIFFTDYHFANNAQNSLSLIKYIMDSVPSISHVVFGGDILNSHTREVAERRLNEFAKKISLINPIILYGNHDNNSVGKTPAKSYLDNSVVYSIIGKQNEKFGDTNKDWYFYIDNPTQKIRYIFIDTGTNSNISYVSASLAEYHHQVDQRRWLLNLLKDTENGYSVCVIAHWLYTNGTLTTNAGELIKAILDAVKNRATYSIGSTTWNFADKNIDIMFALCGHTHMDLQTQDEGSYPIIATTADAYGVAPDSETIPGGIRRTDGEGTVYEQAFDVVQIDTHDRKVYLTRIGYGNDREFTY